MRDLIAIDLPPGEEFLSVMRRAWDAGDAILPVDERLPPMEKSRLLEGMAPAAVVDASGATRRNRGRPVEDGDALVVATSGTSGRRKGVVLTHEAVRASALATSTRIGVKPGSHRWLACLPFSHVGGLSVATRALITGTELSVLPRFEVADVLRCGGPEVFVSLVPTILRRLSATSFHTVVLGGSAPPGDLPTNVVTTYGLTETGSGVVYDGFPLDGVEVLVDPGQGRIRLKGPMLLRCYRDGSVPLDRDGWFDTGDAGSIDVEGRLQVEGRLTDLIVTGGENVWPAQVEAALRSHPGVAEVAVAGRPDPEWGERVVAWVVPASPGSPPTLDSIRGFTREQLPSYWAPKELVIVDSLPRTEIGKVKRDLLP